MKKTKKGSRLLLHTLQHIALVAVAILAVMIFAGSYIEIETKKGVQRYDMSGEEAGVSFVDSKLFNQLLGNNISDIICYGAIRGQMETDTEFDAKKVVDTTAFAERYNGVRSEYITAKYYLDDLIKWSQNGYEYNDVYMTGDEADEFLSRTSTVTMVNLNSGIYSGGTVSYLNSELESVTKVKDVSGNQLETGDYSRDDTNATVMTNRYRSIEGKGIENYVSSWDEYYELCENVRRAADDLSTNYNEYLSYKEIYNADNTNVVYFIRKTIGKDVQVYTNLKTSSQNLQSLKKEVLESCSEYVFFDPINMKYETNTLIEEATLRYIFNGYEYAYPENTQVMIGVKSNYTANDCFKQGSHEFTKYIPFYGKYLTAAICCLLLYLFLMVVLTISEGRAGKTESGEIILRLRKEDKLPTEFMILCAGIWGVIIYLCLEFVLYGGVWGSVDHNIIMVCVGLIVLLLSFLFSFFYYSFVRRIKAGTLWKNSLIRKIIASLYKGGKSVYENSDIALKVWIPFAVFVLIHVIVLLGVFSQRTASTARVLLMLLLLVADIVVGIALYRSRKARTLILQGIRKINEGDIEHKVKEEGMYGENLVMARAVNSIGDSVKSAVETSMKDERLKADLITNVSHDIKTPLTSIINYVDLIKRENVQDPKIREYIEVLDTKSQRLKQLTDDLVEASKISSGNIVLQWEKINLIELLNQTIGEFSEKFEQKDLYPVVGAPQSNIYIEADSRRIWRVIENLFNNIFKYALPGTRVYIDLGIADGEEGKWVALSIKNISANPLKVNPNELTERFIRGDESRTTEGSGLGLSIAKNLTEAQKGIFEIVMDGDLFKVNLYFPLLEE